MSNLGDVDLMIIGKLIDKKINLYIEDIKRHEHYLKIVAESADENNKHLLKVIEANSFITSYAQQFEKKMNEAVDKLIDNFIKNEMKKVTRESINDAMLKLVDKIFYAIRR